MAPSNGWLKFEPALAAAEEIDADYTYFDGLIAEVQRVVDGDPADPDTYPGFAAHGAEIRVLPATVRWQRFDAVLAIAEGYDRAAVLVEAEDRVARYYNTGPIGRDVVVTALIALVKGIPGVEDLVLEWPLVNQPIGDDEVARIVETEIAIA